MEVMSPDAVSCARTHDYRCRRSYGKFCVRPSLWTVLKIQGLPVARRLLNRSRHGIVLLVGNIFNSFRRLSRLA